MAKRKMKPYRCVKPCFFGNRRYELGEIVRCIKQPNKHFELYEYALREGEAQDITPDTSNDVATSATPETPPADHGKVEVTKPGDGEIEQVEED